MLGTNRRRLNSMPTSTATSVNQYPYCVGKANASASQADGKKISHIT